METGFLEMSVNQPYFPRQPLIQSKTMPQIKGKLKGMPNILTVAESEVSESSLSHLHIWLMTIFPALPNVCFNTILDKFMIILQLFQTKTLKAMRTAVTKQMPLGVNYLFQPLRMEEMLELTNHCPSKSIFSYPYLLVVLPLILPTSLLKEYLL